MPPKAARVTKTLLKRWRSDVVAQAIPLEAEHFMPMLREPEALEAMNAFVQKRQPGRPKHPRPKPETSVAAE